MSTARATMKHAAVYSAAAMAGRLVGFIMLPFYAHILRGQGYAVIGMLDVGLGFLLSLLVYGLQGSIIRLYHDEKDPSRKPVVVSTGIIMIGCVTAVLTVPMLFLARPISAFLLDDANLSRLTIMALISFNFDMMSQAASSWLLVRTRSGQMAALSLLRLFTGLSLNIYLILIKGMGLDGYFISSMVVNALSCTIFVTIAMRGCGHEYDPGIARTIRSFLVPLMPGSIASWIGLQMERVLVKILINLESVGILEMGYKFPILISMMVVKPFMQSWETKRFEIADDADAPETISRMFTYFIFMVTCVGLIMAVVIKPVLEFLTPPEFHLAYRIARVEILTLILQGAYYQLIFGLAYAKETGTISKLRGGTSALKVILSWFFISTWGIYGAAFSAAIIAILALVLVFRFSQAYYRLQLEWKALTLITLIAGGLFVWLTRWDVSTTPVFALLNEQILPWSRDLLAHTFLGSWKEGKLIAALDDRSVFVADALIRGALATTFIVVLPIIHPPSRQKCLAFVRTRLNVAASVFFHILP